LVGWLDDPEQTKISAQQLFTKITSGRYTQRHIGQRGRIV